MPSRRTLVQLGLIVLAALFVDALFFTGYYASDDMSYSAAARHLAMGSELRTTSIAQLRLGVNIPSGLTYAIVGGDITMVAWSFVLYHLGLVVAAFAVGRMFHSRRAGLFAAVVVALNPLLYVYAGAMLPDNATALWLALFMIALEKARRDSRAEAPLRRVAQRYLTAGVLLGVAYSCKESAIIMCIPAAIAVIAAAPRLAARRWVRDGVLLAVGLVAVVLVEVVLLRVLADEWIVRLAIDNGDIYATKMAAQGGASPLARLDYAMEVRLRPTIPWTMWLLPAAAAAYILARARNVILYTFFWWPTVFLTIGSTSLSAYHPPTIQARYYSMVVFPAAIMLGYLADAACRWLKARRQLARLPERFGPALLLFVLAVVGLHEVQTNLPRAGNIYRSADVRAFGIAYEKARHDYPQYPVMLSRFFRRRMTPVLYPVPPPAVYGTLYDGRPPPPPPFILIDSAERPTAIASIGDPAALRVRTLDVVIPPARQLDVALRGFRRALGSRPTSPIPQASRGVAILRLVERAADPAVELTPVPAPLLTVASSKHPPPTHARVVAGADGHLVHWTSSRRFYVQRFDHLSIRVSPKLEASRLPGTSTRWRLSTTLVAPGEDSCDVILYSYGYRDGKLVVSTEQRARIGKVPVPLVVDLSAEEPLDAYRQRIAVRPRAKRQRASTGVLQVGEARAEDATNLPPIEPPKPSWHPLTDEVEVVERETLRWKGRANHRVQSFDARPLTTPPTSAASRLQAPAESLQVSVDIGPADADVLIYVLGYANGEEVARASNHTAVGPKGATLVIDIESETPITHYRLRARVTPRSDEGSLRLSLPRATAR